jgi:hypothetical protein
MLRVPSKAEVRIEGRPPSALLLRLSFGLKIHAYDALGKTALPVPSQRTFNARLLKNSLKVPRATADRPNRRLCRRRLRGTPQSSW